MNILSWISTYLMKLFMSIKAQRMDKFTEQVGILVRFFVASLRIRCVSVAGTLHPLHVRCRNVASVAYPLPVRCIRCMSVAGTLHPLHVRCRCVASVAYSLPVRFVHAAMSKVGVENSRRLFRLGSVFSATAAARFDIGLVIFQKLTT